MIVSRTPLRISFAGGGTDLPSFYKKFIWLCISSMINKYIYVSVKSHSQLYAEKIRLNYSETEQALYQNKKSDHKAILNISILMKIFIYQL